MFDRLSKYRTIGQFIFEVGMKLRTQSKDVPELPGIYLIYRKIKSKRELVYIGMAGTMKQNAKFGSQMLRGRINAKYEKKIYRQQYYTDRMIAEGIDRLDFVWYVTFNEEVKDIPAYVEAVLMQEYFEEHGCLPLWNREF